MQTIEFELMPHQEDFVWDVTTPIIGFMGGMRMGKSVSAVHHAIYLSAMHPGKTGVLLSPTHGMTQRNLVPIFRDLDRKYNLGIDGLQHKAPSILTLKWGDKVSTISLECTAENHDRLNGMTLAWAGLDEADKCAGDSAQLAVEQMLIRTSDPSNGLPGQVFVTSTPEGSSAFMADYFIDKSNPMKKLYSAAMTKNYLLSQSYIDKILAQIPAHKRPAYVEGLPVNFNTDTVYSDFDDELNHTNLTLADRRADEEVLVAWDINDGGTSVAIMLNRGKDTFVVEEWMGMKDTKSVLDRIKKQDWANRALVTCDPACTQVFGYIVESKLRQQILKSHPEIEWTITAVNRGFCNGLGERHLFVNTKRCKVITRCLNSQVYVNGAPDKKTFITDAKTDISGPMDALRYGYFLKHPWYPPKHSTPIALRGF